LILLPASQLLIDHIGWRDAYQIFGITALVLAGAAIAAAVAAVLHGSPHLTKSAAADFADEGWTLLSAMRHHAFWALFSTFFFTAIGMYAISPQVVALSDRRRLPAIAGGDRLGVFRPSCCCSACSASPGSTASSAAGRRCCSATPSRLSASSCLWLLQRYPNYWSADRLRHLLRQHDRLTRPAPDRDRDEDLSRRTRPAHHLRRHLDRQRTGDRRSAPGAVA